MNIPELGQVIIPIVTPFNEDESINYDLLGELADWIVSTGRCDSVIVTGTNGEFVTLTDEERIQEWKTVKDAVGDRVTVVAGSGTASTISTIKLTQEAEKLGMDMVMIVGPYYQLPTQDGLVEHYTAVANATSLPVVIYNIPIFAGVNVEAPTVKRLHAVPNIIAVKEECGLDPVQSARLLLDAREREGFKIYDGDDTMALSMIASGAAGVVSGGSHVIGQLMKELTTALAEERLNDAAELNMRMYPVFLAFGGNGRTNPIPGVRRGIELLGKPVGKPRRPLLQLDDDETAELRSAMETAGLFD